MRCFEAWRSGVPEQPREEWVDQVNRVMNAKLFVGNLSFNTAESQLQELFSAHGNVIEVELIMDKFSGRPRGFGFVTMESQEAATAAIQALNGKTFDGRAMTVNEARPREERPRTGGGYRADRGPRGAHGERGEYRQ